MIHVLISSPLAHAKKYTFFSPAPSIRMQNDFCCCANAHSNAHSIGARSRVHDRGRQGARWSTDGDDAVRSQSHARASTQTEWAPWAVPRLQQRQTGRITAECCSAARPRPSAQQWRIAWAVGPGTFGVLHVVSICVQGDPDACADTHAQTTPHAHSVVCMHVHHHLCYDGLPTTVRQSIAAYKRRVACLVV